MKKILSRNFIIASAIASFLWSCKKGIDKPSSAASETASLSLKSPKALKDFVQVNLVGDNNDFNPAHVDANLINAWGVTIAASGGAWVSSMGAGLAKVFTADGNQAIPPKLIPTFTDTVGGHPTGVVANSTQDFKLPNGNPARFIFAQAEGIVSAWNCGNKAIMMAGDTPGELYLGIALASDGGNNFLYIANFSENKIEVFDKNWAEISRPFFDPELPAGYSPWNIQNVDGKLYVMYAKHGSNPGEVVSASPGNGFVDVFNPDGSFVKRFISAGQLNAPWGITKAPAGFWGDGEDMQDIILVGNFGDGHINAYNGNGEFQGQLREHGNPIKIGGLWGIAFAPAGNSAFDRNELFFAAGPGGEKHGLFGFIKK